MPVCKNSGEESGYEPQRLFNFIYKKKSAAAKQALGLYAGGAPEMFFQSAPATPASNVI